MEENSPQINQLFLKLESLLKKQDVFLQEINELRQELNQVKKISTSEIHEVSRVKLDEPVLLKHSEIEKEKIASSYQTFKDLKAREQQKYTANKPNFTPSFKIDLEKFIGENLISKIGIAILVIGVAIGAKYSIEHQLISPLTRIILGYLMGLGLLAFGIKLKKKYLNYSAVLVSGAISILYFITYSAYSFYGLIPQIFTFFLMVVFTIFAVIAAIHYNKQVIAHIGLVGAYAVPFLLSQGSGQTIVLFTYMAIINIGILVIAFKKYWKPLYYSAFVFTWIIFIAWYFTKYNTSEHYALSLTFSFIFFIQFYCIFLAYKLLQKEQFDKKDIGLLLTNSFIFYGLGYSILNSHPIGYQLLGLFTLFNAIIHFVICVIIFKQKLADKNLFYLIVGMILVFITMAIPVQLNGNWVTLLWVSEAALLFWIGRAKSVPVYEKLSYPLMFLSFFSLIQDWLSNYDSYYKGAPETKITTLLNIYFLSSMLFVGLFIFINYVHNNKTYTLVSFKRKSWQVLIHFSIPAILLVVCYYSFRMEISTYWRLLFIDSELLIKDTGQDYAYSHYNYDLSNFKIMWIINYSLLFFSLLSFLNIQKIKNKFFGLINLVLNIVTLASFLCIGLYALSELRDSYLNQTLSEFYIRGNYNIGIRYISYAFVALMIFSIFKYLQQDFLQPFFLNLKISFDIILHVTFIWIASSELITWMNVYQFPQSYQLALSILWGLYALVLIVLGISKKKKHLRIGAIGFFTITLIKLFFYDIAHLDTIAKTIAFVSLGVLLLIISFLYNKYKHVIFDEDEK